MSGRESWDPPANPRGGKTLVVDPDHPGSYDRPSAALRDAGPEDQVFIRPGVYEDKIFVTKRPVWLVGAGRDRVEIFSRRGGPFYLQEVPEGHISGVTFRYVGSDPHSAINLLDSRCTITECRITEGILSGAVIYGPQARPSLVGNEVCRNRESGIFAFAGARPYLARNDCHHNYHFGIAARDGETCPDLVQNSCHHNMMSGILLFQSAQAMLLDNHCYDNQDWGVVLSPDCKTNPPQEEIAGTNRLEQNPRGALHVTHEPLSGIGR